MSRSLPPDQSFYKSTLNERLIILSVAEQGFQIGKDTPYPDFGTFKNGVYLYTENLAITSNISGKNGLTISTWSLACPNDGIIVDVTGAKGADGGKEGQATNGDDGGVLSVFVQDLSDATAATLGLQARGGEGGNTSVTDGTVGNGGNGGMICTVLQPTYLQLLVSVNQLYNEAVFHPEGTEQEQEDQYDKPVVIGDSIYQDAKSVITFAQSLSAEQEAIDEVLQPLVDEISKIDNMEERTVVQVKIGLNDTRHHLQQSIMNQQSSIAPTPSDVRGGYPGIGINVAAQPGKPGADGQETQVFLQTWSSQNFTTAPFPFAHPMQCSMLLERANVFFYTNSPSLRVQAQMLYQRIIDRLSFLPLEPEDPLYQAYSSSPVMPPTSLDDLANIRTKASDLLVQLTSGCLNYDGYEPLWVPRASYTFYQAALDKALADLTTFEDAYIQYHDTLEKQEDLNDKLSIAYNNTSNILASLQADQDDLRVSIQDLDRQIYAEGLVVEKARQELMKAYEAEIAAIQAAFGLSIPQIINALTSIAFSPSKLMGSVQGGSLIYDGFTSVPTIDGGSITKDYLVSEFGQSEATIENISTELQEEIDGEYQLDDPFASKLIVEKEKLLSQLDQFSQRAFGGVNDEEQRKNLEEKFDALIDAMTKRNGSILKYNVTIKLLISKIDEAKTYKETKDDLSNRQVANNDPDLPAITAYVGSIYQASRARVMKLIDILLRSLNFRMVITSDVYNYAFQSGDAENPADLDQVPLTLTSTVLTGVRSNVEDKFYQQVEHWGSEPAKFPGNFDLDEGKRFRLDQFQLKMLLEDDIHAVVVKIPKVDKYSTNGGDFTGCCNIRIYRVRFVLVGLKTSSMPSPEKEALVKFELTQGGDETILDRSNAAFEFKHDPVTAIYSYRLDVEGHKSVLDNGNIGESDINEVATSYAAPGPFAEWTIDMTGTDWENLDVSEVTDGYFDFCGTNYAFI